MSTTNQPSDANDVQFWDKTAEKYSKSPIADQAGYERTVERTRSLLASSNCSTVLELGCGTGGTAINLASSRGGPAPQSYLGTDISPKMIDIANGKIDTPIPGLKFRVATAVGLAAEPTRFDAVLGFNYFHLVRDLPQTLGSIHSMLNPGGLLISKTPCIRDMTLGFVFAPALPVMRAIGVAPFASVFSADELKKQIEAAGFEVVGHVEYHATGKNDTRPFIVARKSG